MESPEYVQSSFCPQFNSDNKTNATGGELFMVDDLLDFSNDDAIFTDGTYDSVTPGNSIEGSTVTALDNSCNSSSFSGCEPNFAANFGCLNFADDQLSGDLVVPCDDLAELEWLSNFVEESFSSEDLQKLQLISGIKARKEDASEICGFQPEPNRSNAPFNPELSVPAKARSKRSRAPPCSWASRLLVVSSTASSTEDELVVLSPQSASTVKKPAAKTGMHRKKDSGDGSSGDGRRCLHCATDKTPQWRTGPMGPKTLCNACGVRYKSGRLVPEYRPAASPTFMLTKHSNSHRKVMELRRQKEMLGAQPLQHPTHQQLLQQQAMMLDASNDDEYLIRQHVGPDIGHLI